MSAPLSRTRLSVRAAAAVATVLAALALLWTFAGGTASAHWPTSTASADCVTGPPSIAAASAAAEPDAQFGWTVSFGARSWSKSIKAGGGNPHIDVFYQVRRNGTWGDWVMLPWEPAFMFGTANNFMFTGQFHLPYDPTATAVRVQARSTAPWSDGTVAQIEDGMSGIVELPVDCAVPPTTTTTTATTTSTTVPTTTPSTVPSTVPETTIVVSPTTVTTVPGTTTTAGGTTTTLVVRSETLGPSTTIAVRAASQALPVTGAAPFGLVALGVGLLTGGGVVARAARSRS